MMNIFIKFFLILSPYIFCILSLVMIYFGAIWYNPFIYVPGAILFGVLWMIYLNRFLKENF